MRNLPTPRPDRIRACEIRGAFFARSCACQIPLRRLELQPPLAAKMGPFPFFATRIRSLNIRPRLDFRMMLGNPKDS